MKLILIIVLICVIMLIAKAVSEQYADRYNFYYNLLQFLKQFKINLSFQHTKVMQFLNEVKAKKQFKIFIEAYKSYLNTNKLDLSQISILEQDELKELENIVQSIGKLDATHEINQIDGFIVLMEQKLKKAEDSKNKLCPMIIKLSLLFAIGLSILLI